MWWDEGRRKMRKTVFSSALFKQRRGLSLFLIIAHISISFPTEVNPAPVDSNAPPPFPFPLTSAAPTKHRRSEDKDGFPKLPSFSRTMAFLKKKFGDAQKTFLPDSVKRTGQGNPSKIQLHPGDQDHIVTIATDRRGSNEKRSVNSSPSSKFRPHQPDITSEMRGGKLNLPVMEVRNEGMRMTPAPRTQPKPTPMANKINPYTNGVASSFPPGIDPYDGFIKYAAENLDTPMGNVEDYHSLEHYYGPQHPLSPYHKNKEKQRGNLYADNFNYLQSNGAEIENSPHPHPHPHRRPPPPPTPRGLPPSLGFRDHNSQGPTRNDHSNHMSSQEHDVDTFHATSPGQPKLKPRPDYASLEDGFSRDPSGGSPTGPPSPFSRKPRPPLNDLSDDNDHLPVPPPDLSVFEEGPPPELLLPSKPYDSSPGPGGPDGPNGPSPLNSPQIQNNEQILDGGDDSIWGILDLAEMLEKGQLSGQSQATEKGKPLQLQHSSGRPVGLDRVVIPIFTRPPPPRLPPGFNEGVSPGSSSPVSASPNAFDYDEHPGLEDLQDGPGKRPRPNSQHLESHESVNDYSDDSY